MDADTSCFHLSRNRSLGENLKLGGNTFYLMASLVDRSRVVDHEIRPPLLFVIRDLRFGTALYLSLRLGFTHAATMGKARYLLGWAAGHHQNLVKAIMRVSFKNQRRFYHDNGMRLFNADLVHPLLLLADHRRMNNFVQLLNSAAIKHNRCELHSVNFAIRLYDFLAKMFDQLLIDLLAGTIQLMDNYVCIYDLRATFGKHFGYG